MITLFLGMTTAIITFFGLIVPIYHYLSHQWKDAEHKGTNPYIHGFFGLLAGYLIGFVIVGSFLSIAEAIAPVRALNCYFFGGGDVRLCEISLADNQVELQRLKDMTQDNITDMSKFEQNNTSIGYTSIEGWSVNPYINTGGPLIIDPYSMDNQKP